MGVLIRDGAQNFGATLDMWAGGPLAQLAERMGVKVPPLSAIALGVPAAIAHVSHSRLIADCPDCGGAEFVWRDGPHVMMCASCFNGAIGGLWRRVEMPRDLAEAEAILAARPLPQNRNWHPAESLDALRAENDEHEV